MSSSQTNGKIPYCLRYAYSTWTTLNLSVNTLQDVIQRTETLLRSDDLKILEHRVAGNQIQLLLSARPSHSPVDLSKITKAKLVLAFSQQDIYKSITREFALRSVGENTSQDLEHYLREQVDRRNFVDDRFADSLRPFSKEYAVDLEKCEATKYGHYWYDLHFVLGTNDRYSVALPEIWEAIVQASELWHLEQGHQMKSISLLPDHVHLLIRPNLHTSPYQVGEGLIERLNRVKIMQNIYHPTFYVATHGAYAMNSIRNQQNAMREWGGL
jgi:REP element-mobilizing transposase RayT